MDGGSSTQSSEIIPMFVHRHLLTTIGAERLRKQQPRGRLPPTELGPIRDGWRTI